MKKYNFTVTKQNKLLKFLEQSLQEYKYSNFTEALRKKDIIVNNERIKENVLLKIGDVVEIYLDDKKIKKKYSVVYEDENIIVFNKQKGIEVCDGDFNLKNDYEKQHTPIYAVHRIDRNTMGLVIFAKNENVCQSLIKIFQSHSVKKYYYAVVKKAEVNNEGILRDYLVKDQKTSTVKIFNKKVPNSNYIETKYNIVKSNEFLSLLNICITAGKTHQIRAHLAHYNMPIVGDEKYGDNKLNKMLKQKTQLLQAYKIEFDIKDNSNLKYLNNVNLKIECAFINLFNTFCSFVI